ncbi:MAG: DnaA regulatory inactivator Hda [Gammaproteobacteria bacterium]
MDQIPLAIRLKDSAVFETYLAGPNAAAIDYLRSVATATVNAGAWIWGPASSGKTHLLQAVCAAAGPSLRAAYLPLKTLSPLGPGALDGWGEHNVLALDDVDVIAGDAAFERALFRLYNDVLEHGGLMLFSTTEAPGNLAIELPDLASRLAAGVVFQLLALDDDERIEALKLRARHRGFELPEETAQYLLRRLPRDMASLYDWLDLLDVASLAAKRRLTIPFVREVLARSA